MSRITELDGWNANWRDLKVAVLGLGVSGFSVADTLAELACDVRVFAQRAEPELLDVLDVLGVPHFTGEEAVGLPSALVDFEPELLITSPGVRPDSEIIAWCNENEIPVWVDIDLAWRLRDKTARTADWICVTGTNGKTTTVQLVTQMLRAGGLRAESCGNIGTPILDCIRDPQGFDVLVVELSSFQLHYMQSISPHSSAVLNIDQDHIDWHGTFEAYKQAKAKVYEGTRFSCIYNVADSVTERLLEDADVVEGARAIGFTVGAPSRSQIGYVEDILCDRAFLEERATKAVPLATFDDIASIGVITPHLLANIAAASALARSYGVSHLAIAEAIRTFKLDAHRIEVVGEFAGITWIDDSKATNPHAAAASLNSFENIVWIVGGLLKGVDIAPLVERFASRLRGAVVIGEDRQPVLEALRLHAPEVPVIEVAVDENAQVMPQAVAGAAALAQEGDVVLLAPSSASMDQFKDYADRGARFSTAVNEWGKGNG